MKIIKIINTALILILICSCTKKQTIRIENHTTSDSVNIPIIEEDTLSEKAGLLKRYWQNLINSQSIEAESINADLMRESCMGFGTYVVEVKDKEGLITKHSLADPLPENMSGVRLILFEDGKPEFKTSFWIPKDEYSFYRLFLE